ncbi:helix-turn-helix domain-containing protein [Kitasatospora acidiphila]|uniref:helix-turn-helix domain-containing protein n=1 Tax=Kitasatospora acidiphila TaxID=2567942 RepID=UPI003C7639AA
MTDRSLTLPDRRRVETQLEIATAAAELFAEHGADATTAEDNARTAGVGLRRFCRYRHFRSKEDAPAGRPTVPSGRPSTPAGPLPTPPSRPTTSSSRPTTPAAGPAMS